MSNISVRQSCNINKNRQLIIGLLAGLCALLAACSGSGDSGGDAQGPVVLAAASLQESMEAAADDWAAQGHSRPILSFAGSSALARQINSGAPGDVFVSADQDWMDNVEQGGHIQLASRRTILGNAIVLIGPAGKGEPDDRLLDNSDALLAALNGGRLAMANPDAVPAGKYGKAGLQSLGLWNSVSDKVASAENVRAALALVERGQSPLGVVYATDAAASDAVQVLATFPDSSHPPIRYPAALLSTSTHPDVSGFLDYLGSQRGQAVFRRFGFTSVSKANADSD
ncbi:molybdate ABC transporter substrate-binding protein [Altericroceibacterium spongiae]|uniref:Molybdate ABC transporter substrate-binding protein n=1 Tax=Altericroceibacterium spongiae TaxID=2320269 RepID=A0A420EK20_9SPHN|nr:molybdate ABC transporter substrate-binding protein [Altericroceibacterium spongiae]RKF21023.1 molybdate ABC transporter substrate-binding protein [Altericroceibacterium spongiae]